VFIFLRLLPTGDTTKCRSAKNGKNCVFFSPPQDDRVNRSRQNFAGKRIHWVCYSTPNLALIGKSGSVQEPQKCQNLPKIVVFGHRKLTQSAHSDEILACKCRPWVCSSTPNLALIGKRGSVRESLKYQKLPKIMVFWPPEADTMNTFR